MATSSLPSRRRSPARSGACSAMRCRRRCGVPTRSAFRANRITLLRDKDGDGVAETRKTFMEGLNQPFGMALLGDTFYVGNTDGVMAFPYVAGADSITARGQETHHLQAGRALDAQPAAEPRWQEALCRRRLAHQHRRPRHGGRRRPRLRLRTRSGERHEPHLRGRPAQRGRPRMGAEHRRALDRGQRARRARRRDTSRLSDLGARRRFLRLALLLLGEDGGRSRAAGPGHGRESDHAGLRARRAHRVARPVLAPGRHASGLSGRHGHRTARLLESQHAERLQGRLHSVRERPPVRTAARYPERASSHRTRRCPTDGRSESRSAPTARCWWRTMSAM